MVQKTVEGLDPRIRRTRRMLQEALDKLLKEKSFEEISVQDITGAASVNRATFYDHYGDKTTLLRCMVAERFHELLTLREVQYDGSSCSSALNAIVLALADYLEGLLGPSGERPLAPYMESAVIAILRGIILDGTTRETRRGGAAPPEMVAAAVSWAIYGAVKEWAEQPSRPPAEEIAGTVASLVVPMLHPAA